MAVFGLWVEGVFPTFRKSVAKRVSEMEKETAKEGFRRLAFGSIKDAVRLILCEKVNPQLLRNMDLFSVSEIRRSKNGDIEIRFFDRMEALQRLSELEKSEGGGLLSAIESGAAALRRKEADDA